MTADIVVLGGLNMDLVVHTPRLPRPGETVEAADVTTTPGGKGANQAIAAARAHEGPGSVAIAGLVGDDTYGEALVAFLRDEGVDVECVGIETGCATGLAIIFIDAAGENTVTAIYGANSRCGAATAQAVAGMISPGTVLLVQQEIPLDTTLTAMSAARSAGATVILDPAPARELPPGFLRHASIITPNQVEAEALAGVSVTDVESACEAARIIQSRHEVETVIVTLGEHGALLLHPDGRDSLHAPHVVEAVASVAAGDAFNGALAAALAGGMTIEEATEFAAVAGALSVTREGAGASTPFRAEILRALGSR